jgi:L-2-hydroxyglutarate oxidase LhgO
MRRLRVIGGKHSLYPHAKSSDWELEVAGQRVQIIKPDPKRGGILEFGTELVPAPDNSLVAAQRHREVASRTS